MDKKNDSYNNFEVSTPNKQGVASLLGVRRQDKGSRIVCIHSIAFDYGWSGKTENRCIQTLRRANCKEAKIRIWDNSYTLSTFLLLSPRPRQLSIPLRSLAQNQTNSVFCDGSLNWMGLFYSEYHAGSCGFNPHSGSITHGHSNRGRIVSVVWLAFSNPKFIAGSRFKTFMLVKTSHSETPPLPPLPSGRRRNSCKELWFRRTGYYLQKMSCIVCLENKM